MSTYPFEKRRFARALAAEIIYRSDLLGEMPSVALGEVLQRENLSGDQKNLLENIVETYSQRRSEIEELLRSSSDNWKPGRMLILDRSIIKAGVAEMLWGRTPYKVVISEAVEIAKVMSTERSPGFVNGVLDRAARRMGLADVSHGSST